MTTFEAYTQEKRAKLYAQATRLWGSESQLTLTMEEAMELALALRKELRNNTPETFERLVDAIADMKIMIEQLEHTFKAVEGFQERLEHITNAKLLKLEFSIHNERRNTLEEFTEITLTREQAEELMKRTGNDNIEIITTK